MNQVMQVVDIQHRYWLFDIPEFYPSGGLYDIEHTTDNVEEAHVLLEDNPKLILFDSITRLYYWEEDDEWRY
ncbi:hypothetical protein CHOTACABRAS_6 [Bacillus phage Chotacabras]|nr:hypothetical protein CHOTACABRAS_6 [Bacillus phage Chotacabras]